MGEPTNVVLRSTWFHITAAKVVAPVVRPLARHHLDPNWITGSSAFIAFGAGCAIWRGWWWTAVVLIAFNGICDVIDGELARALESAGSRKFYLKEMGNVLDGIIDRFADLFISAGLILHANRLYASDSLELNVLVFGLVMAIGLHIISSFLRAKLERHGYTFKDKQRPLTRAGFHLVVCIVCLCTRYMPYDEPTIFFWANLLTVCALTVYTLFKRMVEAYSIFYELDA